jgi:DNA-binding beta-propeller fold protein YncE/mono/diheme cytochrome c family protein
MQPRFVPSESARASRRLRVHALSLAALLGACGDNLTPGVPGVPDAGPVSDAGPGVTCIGEALPLQNPRAFPLGETFYLPALAPAGCPPGAAWRIAGAPAGSENAVHATGAPAPRFTPDVAGDYAFDVPGVEGSEVRLTAVAFTPAERFRNHHLTPLYGAAQVGDEIWVANGASYTVTRVGRQGDRWAAIDTVPVGAWPAAVAWREGLPYGVVALRGSDTVGFLDRDRGVLTDALWVGDEPTGLAISPDAATLYVSLPTMREVAIVDLDTRTVTARAAVGFDPRALALSADGARLFVASYRSGNPQKDALGSYGDDAGDVWIIDTASRTVVESVSGVSAALRALAPSANDAGAELYVAATDGDPIPSQADPEALPFIHEIVAVGADPQRADHGQVLRRADLTRQPGSAGPAVGPAGVAVTGDVVWVAAESSNLVLRLDRATLAELGRVEVGDGPRQIVPLADGGVAVHCFQSFELWILDAAGQVDETVALTEDPRPAAVALGERVFYRPGGRFASNHACASCHVETQNEGMIWHFGPERWSNVRPLQLLDATTPIGWDGYVSSTENFGYQGPGSIVGSPATPDEAAALGAFLGSLLGAPRANGHTRLDGSYTEAALRGKALFEGKAGCAACHAPPLYTGRTLVEEGKSGEPADIPSLLGVYRHGVYFVAGQARSLDAALDVAIAYVGAMLTSAERADLLAFLQQLTPKGSAPLAIWPDLGSAAAVSPGVQPYVAFADPVDDTRDGRSAAEVAAEFVTLEDADGDPVPATISITTGATAESRIVLTPDAPLAPGATYRFRVRPGLPFRSGGVLEGERSAIFTVAAAASATLPDMMQMTATIYGPSGPVELPLLLRRDPSQAGDGTYVIEPQLFGTQQRQVVWVRLEGAEGAPEGDRFLMEPFALPVSPTGAAGDARDFAGTVVETDAEGRAARIEGTFTLRAPGLSAPGLRFVLTAAAAP